ncbi:unnamed protein product [Clonostachys chloroleuca]|uniref:Zn(2)-C6 fungal-type domain-containing protein n=1 Tax=Clonostachys chloroleuca TaxID=1926264 RepID=A0AA35PVI9_9HYPO|nr:unnamed protein product [Clonostachys chloroleuca]
MPPISPCIQCTQRHLLCDGQQPHCGSCQASNKICEMPQRGSRGSKKGYLKALRSRLSHLEGMLERRMRDQQQGFPTVEASSREMDHTSPPHPPASQAIASHQSRDRAPMAGRSAPETMPQMIPPMDPWPDFSQFPQTSLYSINPANFGNGVDIPFHVQAELNQLYFDRVHPSLPVVHQRRFMSRTKSNEALSSSRCLQYAMWTLSTLFSAQFRHLTETIHLEAKQLLDGLIARHERDCSGDTQLVQASVLVAVCESVRAHHQQAWMSAGRSFRLVQGMRFHEIDKLQIDDAISSHLDITETEERRRTFWVAYLLDHLFSMRNDWPVTLSEHVLCTRMPAPEEAFQNSHNTLGPFLSEAIVAPGPAAPFNECLILATICGRSLLHSQQHKISLAYGGLTVDWAAQNQRLDETLTSRLKAFSEYYGSPATKMDSPLSDFVGILGQTTVVYMCKGIMETLYSSTNLGTSDNGKEEIQLRASNGIAAIISLLQPLREIHFSKIHPFMPLVLFFCAEFLYNNRTSHESFRERIQGLMVALSELQNVNDPEQTYLDLLPRSCISSTSEWLEDGTDGMNHR